MAAHSLIKGLIVGSGLLAAAVQASSGDHRLNARDNGGYRPEPQGHFVCVEQHKIVKVTVGEPGGECTMTTAYPGTSVGYPPGTTLTPTPTSTPPPAFSCDEGGYLVQGTVLYRLNLETGDNPAVNENVGPGGNINAIGYNILDNYLYGFVAVSGGRWQLIQIDAEGGHQLLPLTVDRFYSTGDIDANGQLWIGASGTTAWAQIDLDPDSARYGQLVDSGTMKVPGNFVADWVFLENGGPYLYSIAWSTTARLVRWSIERKEWTEVRDYGNVTPAAPQFGALYAVGDEMWGSDNASGKIIAFPVLDDNAPARDISAGPPSNSNDGARCFAAPAPSNR
ncbi:hypothetical protein FPOAC2_14418 [Fusarium poae]|uniref:DUF6923 domain-containing protein n=1 Tax=Fusarium poae TaxID=36050 RepID=A0A1B8A693_FUSPO|nr:uncharacterized protein FPOAC1_013140 [Fusarium poae]KAG8665162.1 hypothetical protein FPOAC1_013140 [Fusarium poae]OBS15975.1 hypothetical protein FPOA_13254 [Fusarium poae]